MPTVNLDKIAPATAWTSILERPLTAEVRNLTRDTESGVRFVVACLDVSPLSSTPLPEGPSESR